MTYYYNCKFGVILHFYVKITLISAFNINKISQYLHRWRICKGIARVNTSKIEQNGSNVKTGLLTAKFTI